jgi:hypothetical protein
MLTNTLVALFPKVSKLFGTVRYLRDKETFFDLFILNIPIAASLSQIGSKLV